MQAETSSTRVFLATTCA